MTDTLEPRRLAVFLALAFGIAWATAAAIFLTGGLTDSPTLVSGLSLALVLVAGPYMFAPALANVGTRLLTDEGWERTFLHPRARTAWRPYLTSSPP